MMGLERPQKESVMHSKFHATGSVYGRNARGGRGVRGGGEGGGKDVGDMVGRRW